MMVDMYGDVMQDSKSDVLDENYQIVLTKQ